MSTPSIEQADVLAELGHILGIPLTFDDQGQCFMMFDERMVSLRALDERFVLYGMLGDFPDEEDSAFWKHLMSINTSLVEGGHGVLAVDEDTDVVMLMKSVASYGMSAPDLANVVAGFVDHLDHLVGVLERELPGEASPESDPNDVAALSSHFA